jgi:glucose dehydrogenase
MAAAGSAACRRAEHSPPRNTVTGTGVVSGAVAGIRVIAPLANGEWRQPSGDYANLRYSPLDDIKPSNVANLRAVTVFSTGIPNGHEGQPWSWATRCMW